MNDQNFPPRAPLPATAPMPPTFPITFDDLEASARRALDRMQSTSEAIAAIRTEHSDEDERVTVVVSGTGELLDLRIDDSAMSMEPDELARLVVSTAHAAAGLAFGDMGAQVAQLTEMMNSDPGVLGELREREARRD